MTQRVIEINSPSFVCEQQLAATAGIVKLFPLEQPLVLEIGCGTGHFIVDLARQQPHRNYLAIDIYNKGCYKTCAKIDEAGLDNVRVLRMEARYLLNRFCTADSLAAVYVNCPDPWPKKRHRYRRLINCDFLRLLLYYLHPHGEFFFATDFTDYAADVAEILPFHPGYRNRQPTSFCYQLPGYPSSKYMRRFLDQGQPIYYFHYQRVADFKIRVEELPEIVQGFRIRWGKAANA